MWIQVFTKNNKKMGIDEQYQVPGTKEMAVQLAWYEQDSKYSHIPRIVNIYYVLHILWHTNPRCPDESHEAYRTV